MNENLIDIDAVKEHYHGFFLSGPVGNNAFSYDQRETKQIFVAPLIEGDLSDLSEGIGVAFSEVRDGKEHNAAGLTDFVHTRMGEKDIFIFDNHNHAFFFWNLAIISGRIPWGLKLVHVDQQKETCDPWVPFDPDSNLAEIFDYTNFVLNVKNFIKPALDSGLFSGLENIVAASDFEKDVEGDFVLDIDMDVFAPEMDYISYDKKISRLRNWLSKAAFITIATSPFFIDQRKAIRIIKDIFVFE